MSTLTEKSEGRMLVPVKWALKRCNKAIKARQFTAVIEQLWNSVPIPVCKDIKVFVTIKDHKRKKIVRHQFLRLQLLQRPQHQTN